MNEFGFTNYSNSYVSGRNDAYYYVFRSYSLYFPIQVKVVIENKWEFVQHYPVFKIIKNTDYDHSTGGGNVEFDEEVKITISPFTDGFDMNGFKAESDEFSKIKNEVVSIILPQSKEKRKITKTIITKNSKTLSEAISKLVEDLRIAIDEQIKRRFDEYLKAFPERAIDHLDAELKDMFLF